MGQDPSATSEASPVAGSIDAPTSVAGGDVRSLAGRFARGVEVVPWPVESPVVPDAGLALRLGPGFAGDALRGARGLRFGLDAGSSTGPKSASIDGAGGGSCAAR